MAKSNTQAPTPQIDSFDGVISAINNVVGSNTVYSPAANGVSIFDVPRRTSGVLALDYALYGGIPNGKNIYLYGPPSSCKSTLMYLYIAEITNRPDNNKVFLEDVENSFDINWARNLGVNLNNIQVSRCACMEQSLDVITLVMQSGIFAAIFLDSIAALTPKVVIDGSVGDVTMGVEARMLSKFFKALERDRMIGYHKSGILTDFIYSNQIRYKLGVMFGNPLTEPGGEAPKFYAAVRIKLANPEEILENDEQVGGRFPFMITKNKTAPAWKKGSFALFTDGDNIGKISNEETLLGLCESSGVILKRGSWYYYGEERLANGIIATSQVLKELPSSTKNEMLSLALDRNPRVHSVAFRFKDGYIYERAESTKQDCNGEPERESEQEGEAVC